MPSWTDFLLPHPDPSSSSSSNPSSPRHAQPPTYTHHLSAQGYLQPPPRSRYRPQRHNSNYPSYAQGLGSASSSAQSSAQDLSLSHTLSLPPGLHRTGTRTRADSAVINSASCSSFGYCASAREKGKGSWQAVASVFGASSSREEKALGGKRDRKGKGKEKERSPPPRIGALAFEVGDETTAEESELEDDTGMDWENVSMAEAAGMLEGEDVYAGGVARRVGLAISRSLLRSRSGDDLGRGRWSGSRHGERSAGGSEGGMGSRGTYACAVAGVGGGIGRGRGSRRRKEPPRREGAELASITDAVDQLGVDEEVGDRLESRKTPTISINGVELVGVGRSLSTRAGTRGKTDPSLSQTPSLSSSDVPPLPILSCLTPSASTSTSAPAPKPAEDSPDHADINIEPRRRHRADGTRAACAIDDDTALQHSGCSSSSSSPAGGSGPGNRESEDGQRGQRGACRGASVCDVPGHAAVDRHQTLEEGGMGVQHERGGDLKEVDRNMDDNIASVGDTAAAVDGDGDIDTVIIPSTSTPVTFFDLHLDHFPLPPTSLPVRSAARSLHREDDSEDTPVVRTRPLPSSDSLLESAPGTQPLSPNFSEHQVPPATAAQSLPFPSENLPPPNPAQPPPMGLLNLGLAMARTPMMPPAPGTDARRNHRRSIDALSVASRASSKESKASSSSKLTKPTAAKRKSKPSGSLTSATATATAATANIASASSLSPSPSSPLQAHFASDAFASPSPSSDVRAKSQNLLVPSPMSMPIPPPSSTLLLPTLTTPTAVSPLGFDPSTYFDSFSSWSMTAATMSTSPKMNGNILSASTSSKPGSSALPARKLGKAWCLRDAVSKDDEEEGASDSDSETETEEPERDERREGGKTNGTGTGTTSAYTDPLVSPSILPSVLALATLDAPQASAATKSAAVAELNPLFRPSILCPPKPAAATSSEPMSGLPSTTDVNPFFRPSILASASAPAASSPSTSTQTPTPAPAPISAPVPTFAPVAPLFIAKKNPQKRPVSIAGSPFASASTPPSPAQPASQSSGSGSGVASLLARRFSFNSSSRPKPKSTYSSNSVNSRGSSPAPSPGNSRPTSPSPLRNESFERRVAEVVSMLERASVSASAKGKEKETAVKDTEPTPSTSAAPPSAWQRLDAARSGTSASNTTPSTASASSVDTERDAFFEFGVGSSGHGSGSGTGNSRVSTPGTSPGPGMMGAPSPSAGSSLAKRWRRWSSNNLGGGWSGDSPSRGSARPNLGTTSSTSSLKSQRHVQIQKEAKVGRSMGGEGGGVVQLQRVSGSTEAAGPAITEGLGDDVEVEASRTSTSTSIGAASSTMPFSAPVSLPSINTASGSSTTARKLVKPRPNVRSASVDDQPHHDENLHRVFSANDLASGSSSSSAQLKRGATTKKPKFTLGGYSYGASSNSDGVPDSPKASSSKSAAAARLAPARGSTSSLNAASTSSPTSVSGGLARRDTASFRPPLIRRDAVATPEQATRRWTLASAITDEAISDEGLLKELERIRMVGEWDRRRAKQIERERARENSSGSSSRRRGQGPGVDRRTRTLSLDAAEVVADAEAQAEEDLGDEAERTDEEDTHTEEEEDTEEVRLWEIDVGFEIWEGREGMLARERAREMERARAAERQRLDREKEDSKQDGDAASVSTGSSGHTSSSMSAEHSLSTTPETTPAFSPLTISPGLAASGSPESSANKTSASASLVKQPAPTWLAAQRALLICRELILTERRYLGLMRLLLDTHSVNPYVAMRTSASTSDIASMQAQYQGIQQQLQYRSSSAITTYSSLPPTYSSSTQQTHVLVGPAPPARMLAATLPLADVTARFLRAMEGAPSVGGVAKAFVEHEVELEEAYVAWCREVGNWFVDGATSASDATSGSSSQSTSVVSKVPSPPGSTDGHTSHGHEDISASSTIRLVPIPPPSPPLPGIPPFAGAVIGHASQPPPSSSSSSATSPLKRVAGSWRRSMTSIPSLVGGGSNSGSIYTDAHVPDRKREKEVSSPVESSPSSPTTALASGFVFIGGDRVLSPGAGPSSNAVASAPVEAPPAKPLRKLGLRDLAILPTQRVMRYVLLYRDLLAHTPTAASSRVLVERALAIATRIADACDRAQGHAAFIAPNPASSSPSSTSSPNSNTTNPKTVSAHSLAVSGMTSGATASRSGSGASNSSGSSGSSWRRKSKSKTRSRTASLSGGAVPALTPMTPVVRAGIPQKS